MNNNYALYLRRKKTETIFSEQTGFWTAAERGARPVRRQETVERDTNGPNEHGRLKCSGPVTTMTVAEFGTSARAPSSPHVIASATGGLLPTHSRVRSFPSLLSIPPTRHTPSHPHTRHYLIVIVIIYWFFIPVRAPKSLLVIIIIIGNNIVKLNKSQQVPRRLQY